jgi:acyl-CoA thioester hydrolase
MQRKERTKQLKKDYFSDNKSIPPLRAMAERTVRFEETDQLGIVWHGRYPSYLEDARTAFGDKYGIGYLDFYKHHVVAPIKQMHLDYERPLRFTEVFTVEIILHWSDAARINFSYIIRDKSGLTATTGYTVQVMLDTSFNLLLVPPPFYEKFREKWQKGELT